MEQHAISSLQNTQPFILFLNFNLFPFRKNKVRKLMKCVHVATFEPSHQFSQNLTNYYAMERNSKLGHF